MSKELSRLLFIESNGRDSCPQRPAASGKCRGAAVMCCSQSCTPRLIFLPRWSHPPCAMMVWAFNEEKNCLKWLFWPFALQDVQAALSELTMCAIIHIAVEQKKWNLSYMLHFWGHNLKKIKEELQNTLFSICVIIFFVVERRHWPMAATATIRCDVISSEVHSERLQCKCATSPPTEWVCACKHCGCVRSPFSARGGI